MDREMSPGSYENDGFAILDMDDDNPLASVWRSMALHSKYLESFDTVHQFLLTGDGPLPQADRHYIAIMASARYSCTELISRHIGELQACLPASPSPPIQAWLNSGLAVEMAPLKLQQLHTLNSLLAHRPWMITKHHIQELTQGDGRTKWLLSELVQAIILMSHFHAFSSFVLGCGIMNNQTEEEDDVLNPIPESGIESSSPEEDPVHIPVIVKKMETLRAKKEDLEMSELARRFEKIDTQEQEPVPIGVPSRIRSRTVTPLVGEDQTDNGSTDDVIDPAKFSKDLDFQYVDFVKRDDPAKHPTFRTQEFSWDDHAFTTVNRFYSEDMGQLLDDKFNTITNLTYMTIGKYQSVDTRLFRRAVQCYIQCLYGIRHDDYDYGNINELLPRTLKKYIKTLSCYPELCTPEEYNAIMSDFRNSEKVHVCILVCEAKFQSGLIYALKAVADYYA